MDKIIVSFLGLVGIGSIYWFFFGKKETAGSVATTWNILVDGGYKPATIRIPPNKTSSITFTRKDPSSCLEDVIIEDFKIKKFLPLNEAVTITLSPTKPGTYTIHCGMNMFHGRLIVI